MAAFRAGVEEIIRGSVLYNAQGETQAVTRPMQLFTRWYGFSYIPSPVVKCTRADRFKRVGATSLNNVFAIHTAHLNPALAGLRKHAMR